MKESDCKEAIEQWSYNLYNMETMNTQLPFSTEKPIFKRMAEVANFPQMSTEQQQVYMRSLNRYRTFLATKDYDYNRGRTEGRAEGRAEATIDNAKRMIAAGIPEDLVLATLCLKKEDLT